MKKLNLKIDIVLEYLGAIYYLEEKNYDSDKLNLLLSIKKELFENGLLEINPIFLDYLSNVSIILYGYETVDPFYINIFSEYKKVGSIKRATDIITDIIFCKCVSLFSDSYINVG